MISSLVGIVPKSRSGGETGHKDGTSAGSFKWGKIFAAEYYGRIFGQLPKIANETTTWFEVEALSPKCGICCFDGRQSIRWQTNTLPAGIFPAPKLPRASGGAGVQALKRKSDYVTLI